MTLVFGGNSFVAKNLNYKNKISKSDCDLTKYDEIIGVLKYFKPNSVINCAAAHGSAKSMSSRHSYYLDYNLTIDSNLLKACHSLNIRNVVLLSSVSAFPNIKDRDLVETDIFNGEVNDYNFGYNTSKRISCELCKSYELDYGRNYKVLFLGNLYGKYGNFSQDSNVLNSIIYQVYRAKLDVKNLSLYGTGEDQRAFTFVEDLNQLLEKFIADKSIKSAIFSSNEVYTIKEISTLVAQKLSFKGDLNFTGEINAGQKRKVASSAYIQGKVPGLKFTSLEMGLAKVIEWYVSSI
jgi:GDP-L-fucose synthase